VSSACDSNIEIGFDEHKMTAVSVLEENVDGKYSLLYSADNWNLILNLLEEAKTEIDGAQKKIRVDFLLIDYIKQINNVPKRLNNETVTQIKEDALNLIYTDSSYSIKDFKIFCYGTFNGHIVIMIYNQSVGFNYSPNYDILGIRYLSKEEYILIWKKGEFHRLSPVYKQGLLTRPDLEEIADIHKKEYLSINFYWEYMF